MQHLLLRARKDTFEVVSPEASLDRNTISDNSGNLIFLGAAQRILTTRHSDIDVDRLVIEPRAADRINERYDAYVIPLANALRVSYEANLIKLTRLIERLRIPVVVLGVGAQSDLDFRTTGLRRIEPAIRAFVGAVLDHGPSIGVRGAFTAEYLAGLGFRDVAVVGCPSIFLQGPGLRVDKRSPSLTRDAKLTITVSPYVTAMDAIVAHHLDRYPGLRYVAQDIATLDRLLWAATPFGAGSDRLLPAERTSMYVDPWPWIEDLRDRDLVFGSRIHGAIAAILAGTPAFVLAHDSRTLELAEYLAIPHRRLTDVAPDVDAAELYEAADFGPLNDGHAGRFATFAAYLERHGLHHVFETGEDPAGFIQRLAATPFPPAVTQRDPALAAATARLGQRFRRLVRGWRTSPRVRAWRAAIVRGRRRTARGG